MKTHGIGFIALVALVILGCSNHPEDKKNNDYTPPPPPSPQEEEPTPTVTSLTIKNQSFTDLTEITWNGYQFSTYSSENEIAIGEEKRRTIEAGSGYIFFKRKSHPMQARTKQIVSVNKNEEIVFTFTDNTLIVEKHNKKNTGMLSTLESTVVFFDDMEGEMQPYKSITGYAGYYNGESDLNRIRYSSSGHYFHYPIHGKRALAFSGSYAHASVSSITLTAVLQKPASLSFWYAAKYVDDFKFSIKKNEAAAEEKIVLSDTIQWSKEEFELEAGSYEFVWSTHSTSTYIRWASLDDIQLIYK